MLALKFYNHGLILLFGIVLSTDTLAYTILRYFWHIADVKTTYWVYHNSTSGQPFCSTCPTCLVKSENFQKYWICLIFLHKSLHFKTVVIQGYSSTCLVLISSMHVIFVYNFISGNFCRIRGRALIRYAGSRWGDLWAIWWQLFNMPRSICPDVPSHGCLFQHEWAKYNWANMSWFQLHPEMHCL